MADVFRSAITRALPDPTEVQARLGRMTRGDVLEVTEYFVAALPDADAVITVSGAELLSQELADSRGVPELRAAQGEAGEHLTGDRMPERRDGEAQPMRAVIMTRELLSGLPELHATLLAQEHGWEVVAVAAVLERSDEPGRVRLELLGIPVISWGKVAQTPDGLVFEQRLSLDV